MSDSDTEYPTRGRFQKAYQPYVVRVTDETLDEIRGYDDCTVIQGSDRENNNLHWVEIETREGTMEANKGDWIAEDQGGRHYRISDDQFRQMYEPVQ